MSENQVVKRGLVLLGCGKMGSAMLQGWLKDGLPNSSVHVVDPFPSDWLKKLASDGLNLNQTLPKDPAVCLLAVKPQMMGDALPSLKALDADDTLFVSIAAGTPIAQFEQAFGQNAKIIRAMPNTPAAIGQGITALVGNAAATSQDLETATQLLSSIGETVHLENEAQMDAVTGLSGSGPAYVFHLVEAMAEAGIRQGLNGELAMRLAKQTVAGAGALVTSSDESPEQLRINVTSPKGTTEAALKVLMDESNGLTNLMDQAITAATDRSKELSK